MSFQSFVSSVGQAVFNLAYVISPIILIDGVASGLGGMLPIALITEASDLGLGLLSGTIPRSLDDAWAHFMPLPGSTLIDNQYGTYPFANAQIAANAVIQQPTRLSMLMICPTRDNWISALGTMTLLVSVLNNHIAQGGTFSVATPKQIYTNGLMERMTDVSTHESHQPQNMYQLDFFFPLLTLVQAAAAQNSLMSKLSSGAQITGDPSYSGVATSVGVPQSLSTGTILPQAAGVGGTTIAPPTNAFSAF